MRLVVAASSSRAWGRFDEGPDLSGAADADGGQAAGEVDDGVGVVALEEVEGAQRFLPRRAGWALRSRNFVSDAADSGCLLGWPEPIVGEYVHSRGRGTAMLFMCGAMRSVEIAPLFSGKVIPRFVEVDEQGVLHAAPFDECHLCRRDGVLSTTAASPMTDLRTQVRGR
jgi:hypothetical protein